MKIFRAILPALVVCSSILSISAQDNDTDDFQFWSESKLYFATYSKKDDSGKSQKVLSPHFIGTIRVGNNLQRFVNERVGFGVDVRLNDTFKFTPSYIFVADTTSPGAAAYEQRLRFDLTAQGKYKGVTISDRSRVEFRLRHERADDTRYRNKLKAKFDIPTGDDGKISPFGSVEAFYSKRSDDWFRVEYTAGIERKINDRFSIELFYLLRKNNSGSLRTINGIGSNFKIYLD